MKRTVLPLASDSEVSGPIESVPLVPATALEATEYWMFNKPKTSPGLIAWAAVGEVEK